MSEDALLKSYTDKEVTRLTHMKGQLVAQGRVESYKDLYPELTDISGKSLAYCRGLTPLQFLLLLYDKVVLHIPPRPADVIEARYGMRLEDIWQLVEGGVILPVINNPSDYTQPHLAEFLERGTPSVWMRGVDALFALGLGDTLDERHCPLPVSEMAALPNLRSRFAERFGALSDSELTERVKADILVNYADLSIFGLREFADGLAELGSPQKVFDHLYLFSELLTYPHLFGFGGTANYDELSILRDAEFLPIDYAKYLSADAVARINPRTAERLLRAIGIEMRQITWRDVVDFHASGDGAKLRDAMTHFESAARKSDLGKDAAGELVEYQSVLDLQIREATRLLSSPAMAGASQSRTRTLVLKVGIAALGGAAGLAAGLPGGPVGAVAGALLGGIAPVLLEDMIPERLKQLLTTSKTSHLRDPAIANLWAIRD